MHGTQKTGDLILDFSKTNLEEDGEWGSKNECCALEMESNQPRLG